MEVWFWLNLIFLMKIVCRDRKSAHTHTTSITEAYDGKAITLAINHKFNWKYGRIKCSDFRRLIPCVVTIKLSPLTRLILLDKRNVENKRLKLPLCMNQKFCTLSNYRAARGWASNDADGKEWGHAFYISLGKFEKFSFFSLGVVSHSSMGFKQMHEFWSASSVCVCVRACEMWCGKILN